MKLWRNQMSTDKKEKLLLLIIKLLMTKMKMRNPVK
ncbi:uncharacterized protein METZ01_LOCUS216999 [marine metagenome]|uniref:Uncharacterized protein n=1 Tax=marine metagenome TaxID=408172 RepID=A0A382FNF9_9ZZZZ